MRSKRLIYNTGSSILFQIISVICGFIVPRLILQYYGTNVNGLVNSITNFIKIISFLEFGVGAVVQSALYRPLAERNKDEISKVIVSAQKFFKLLARILVVYIAALIVLYPLLVRKDFGFLYTGILIVALSISSFAQYYFGVVNSLLLIADQKSYILYTVNSVTLVLNTFVCFLLMKSGQGIHAVKLTTSIIFLLRPIIFRLYVDKNYELNRKIEYSEEPIKQKWNGVAQHISSIVLDYTDSIVLTIFSTLANVSIYSVYHLVVVGVKQVFTIATNGVQSLEGELWAKKEYDELRRVFSWSEWLVHTLIVFAFGCTLVLICPFVRVYTQGIEDANYIVPAFAVLITLANAVHGLRLPYICMIFAGGHYKETQQSFVIAALINVIISIAMVSWLGLVGVAIGTLVAMLYQTVWMAWYISKNLVKWPFKNFVKQMLIDVFIWLLGYFASRWLTLSSVSYTGWILLAVEVAAVWVTICGAVNLICYRPYVIKLAKVVTHKIHK